MLADAVTTEAPPPPSASEPAPLAVDPPATPVTWRHAVLWVCLAAVSVVATLVVLDNFILVELRLPGAAVRARLGWVVVTSVGVGFLSGWVVGRAGRRRVRR